MRAVMRRLMLGLVGGAAAVFATGCTVAGALGSSEILEELDEIVRIEGTQDSRTLVYRERALLSKDYMRWGLLRPFGWPLSLLFGRRAEYTLEQPGYHVRGLLVALPHRAGDDPWTCAAAAIRFGWLAELDQNPQTRILALDSLAQLCRQLEVEPFEDGFEALSTPLDPQQAANARGTIRALDPKLREGAGEVSLQGYEGALQTIVSHPLGTWEQRLELVEDLAGRLQSEPDTGARDLLVAALRRAIGHCTYGALVRTVRDRDPRYAEVRLCAMEQIRNLGDAHTVPFLLAIMAASPEQRAAGVPAYDPDELVQLRLIHYCGQLGGELANSVVRLPGQEDWVATSSNEFLARTVLSERDYYSKLRTAAIVALSWSLRRQTIDPDPAWVRQWVDGARGPGAADGGPDAEGRP